MYLSATPAAPPLTSRSTLLPQLARPLISQSTFMPYVTGNLAPVDAQAETTVSPVVLFSDVELSATPTAPSLISRSTLLPQPARPLISQSTFVSYVTGNLAPIDAQAERPLSLCRVYTHVHTSFVCTRMYNTPFGTSIDSQSTSLPPETTVSSVCTRVYNTSFVSTSFDGTKVPGV